MKYLIILSLLLTTTFVNAQRLTSPPDKKVLVVDETEVVASGKSSFRIITSNDTIAHYIMRTFEDSDITRFTYTRKSDRNGKYWERSFYFKNESWDKVMKFVYDRFK